MRILNWKKKRKCFISFQKENGSKVSQTTWQCFKSSVSLLKTAKNKVLRCINRGWFANSKGLIFPNLPCLHEQKHFWLKKVKTKTHTCLHISCVGSVLGFNTDLMQPGASRKEALSILCPYVLVTSTFTIQETYTPPTPLSSMLMVAESVLFRLKCDNMTGPFGLQREMPQLQWAAHMGPGLILLPPACCSSSASPKPKHGTAQHSSGDGTAWYGCWIPAQPLGDSWPASLVQCFLLPLPPTAL